MKTLNAIHFALLAAAASLVLSAYSAHAQGGVPLWTNRYGPIVPSYPVVVGTDGSGNVFVTASSGFGCCNYDYLTIKYSNEGVPLWTNRYNGPGGESDFAFAMAVHSSGDVVVTGISYDSNGQNPRYATIKYSSGGIPLWTTLSGGGAVALDTTGNVIATDLAVTIAYSSAGVPLWTNRYAAGSLGAVAIDGSGNVFVTGSATIKYSGAGTPLWTNLSGMRAISLDSSGNVFVTGGWEAANGLPDYVTIKYSGAGVPLWTNRYNGPANSQDSAWAVAVDRNGNVFVTGESYAGIGECCDYTTIKYSNAGSTLWTRRYNGPGNSQDVAHAIAVDSSGNVFVTGESYGSNGFSDCATIAYFNSGVPAWTNRYDGPANGHDAAYGLALDSRGNVFVTGISWNGTNTDIVTIKYSSSVPPPRLGFQKLNNELVLSWTNAGFHLQTAPALTGPFTNIAGATSPYTNYLTAPQQFFRLISN